MHRYNWQVWQCRAKHLFLTLAAKIQAAPNGPALAAWWEANHGPTGNIQLNRKWDAYPKGAWPRPELLRQLINEVPGLTHVATNPVWFALSDMQRGGNKAFWNSCVNALRIEGKPIGYFSQRRMCDLCAQPNLASVGVFVLLLRGDAPQYHWHRCWVAKVFICYLCIALLSDPLHKRACEIYECIDCLMKDGQFSEAPPEGWPVNTEAFLQLLEGYALVGRRLHAIVGAGTREADMLYLLWLVVGDKALLSDLCLQHEAANLPVSFLQAWQRKCRRFANHSVQLLCSECAVRLLTPAEQRVWNRLLL